MKFSVPIKHASDMRKTSKVKAMKKLFLLFTALILSGLCLAQDMGRVISATPIMQQVGVPRQVCSTEQVSVQSSKSGAGAVMGAIAGGAMGNAVGSGAGKAAATLLGIIGGAVIGDNVEGAPASQVQNVQRCATQTSVEYRVLAYNVVYEFAGKQYSVQMARDPGPSIPLQISPMSDVVASPPPVYVQTSNAVVLPPVYPGYYVQPYYPPIGIQLGIGYGIGYGVGYRGHHRWH